MAQLRRWQDAAAVVLVAVTATDAFLEAVVPTRLRLTLTGPAMTRWAVVAAVVPLGVGATAVVRRALNLMLKVPVLLVFQLSCVQSLLRFEPSWWLQHR